MIVSRKERKLTSQLVVQHLEANMGTVGEILDVKLH